MQATLKVLVGILVLALVGCGGVSPQVYPAVPPQVYDVARTLFASQNNNIGGTFVTDTIAADGLITRNTWTPGLLQTLPGPWLGVEIETHSIYKLDVAAGCIRAVAEEGWTHQTHVQIGSQAYPSQPCWIKGLSITSGQSLETDMPPSAYTWNQIGLNGEILNPAVGSWRDHTVLTASQTGLTLVESYHDLSPEHVSDVPYCGKSFYDLKGIISVSQIPAACIGLP